MLAVRRHRPSDATAPPARTTAQLRFAADRLDSP